MNRKLVNWVFAISVSIGVHVLAAAYFVETPDEIQIAGGAPVQVAVLGNAFEDAVLAGDTGPGTPLPDSNASPAETVEAEMPTQRAATAEARRQSPVEPHRSVARKPEVLSARPASRVTAAVQATGIASKSTDNISAQAVSVKTSLTLEKAPGALQRLDKQAEREEPAEPKEVKAQPAAHQAQVAETPVADQKIRARTETARFPAASRTSGTSHADLAAPAEASSSTQKRAKKLGPAATDVALSKLAAETASPEDPTTTAAPRHDSNAIKAVKAESAEQSKASGSAEVSSDTPTSADTLRPAEAEVALAHSASNLASKEQPIEASSSLYKNSTIEATEAEAAQELDVAKSVPSKTTVDVAAEKQNLVVYAPVPIPRPQMVVKPLPDRSSDAKPVKKRREVKKNRKTARGKGKDVKKSSRAGAKGKAAKNARRGVAEGRASKKKGAAGNKKSKRQASAGGNARVSNFPGKVVRKLRRSLRYPSAARRKKIRGEVRVGFVVTANGRAKSIRIVRSSGSAILDKAALDTVRRAVPFPPIPKAAGRSRWSFTVPLAFVR